MWLYAPSSSPMADRQIASSRFSLRSEFHLWMLTGGKPERVPSSQIDWVKAPWSSGLHVWEADVACGMSRADSLDMADVIPKCDICDMSNQYTYKPPCSREDLERMYLVEGKTFQEIADALGVSVKPIQNAMRVYGIKARVAAPRDQRGPKNKHWKGDDAGYAALHLRVISNRGQPNRCEVCESTSSCEYEWANLTGKYSDVMDYKRMCISCHMKHDRRRDERGYLRSAARSS